VQHPDGLRNAAHVWVLTVVAGIADLRHDKGEDLVARKFVNVGRRHEEFARFDATESLIDDGLGEL
jgi:hypothetical protein